MHNIPYIPFPRSPVLPFTRSPVHPSTRPPILFHTPSASYAPITFIPPAFLLINLISRIFALFVKKSTEDEFESKNHRIKEAHAGSL